MRPELIRHRPRGNYAYLIGDEKAELMLEVGRNDVSRILCTYFDQFLIYEDGYPEITKEMSYVASSKYTSYYRCQVEAYKGRLGYFFKIYFKDGNIKYLNELGLVDNAHSKDLNQFCIPYLNEEDAIKTPDWVKTSVCYQIFPETFNSDKGELIYEPKEKDNQYRFAGGTLNGIREKIPYLKDLGINLLYLTPIFKARTNHRYETVDYMEIDPKLGTKEDFRMLVDELHKNGMRIILDGVFNHTSSEFFAFKDILKNQENSKYKDWYHIDKFPVEFDKVVDPNINYRTFSVVCDMPKLNQRNKEVSDYILNVVSYWTREFGVDGWRLDVANEVSLHFWRQFRETLKNINPDIYIIGESWNDSNCYLQGDVFDGVMNYIFRNYTFRLFDHLNKSKFSKGVKYDVNTFIEKYSELLVQYPRPIFNTLMNIIDSHDVEEIRDDFTDERVVRAISTLELTLNGLPLIYYGTERGMTSDKYFGERPCVHWDTIDMDIYNYYKRLISIRNENKALSLGDISFNRRNDGILSYTKKYLDNEILVMINVEGETTEVDSLNDYEELFVTNKANKALMRPLDILILKKKN